MRSRRPAPAIRLGGSEIGPGERKQLDLPVADLSIRVPITMPVHVINGRGDGPRLFVCAAIHGDEINGVEIIRRVMKLPALKRLRGSLVAVPIVNVPGFLNLSRYLPDRRDLNRSFPGSSKGSLAARIAKRFLDEIVAGSTHGIDLHTGSLHRVNYPQVRGNLDEPEAERMALAFGVPLVLNTSIREGSLRGAAQQLGVPVLVYEAGEALRFDEAAIRAGVNGVMRVMRSLGMLPARKRSGLLREPPILRSSRWVRAPCSGVLRTSQPAGAGVRSGQLLAVISDPLGETETEIVAPNDGVIVGRTNLPLVHEGDALFNIGQTEGTQIVARALDAFDPLDDYENGATEGLAKAEPPIV
ncbi:MAG: succinylglutamate desuccinylase/aspartoacylase family protein [Gammaproteobacteria bacterium]|nr:succinylglutamate desuccinylase/aspartoacylase family protein [Gammaproteobacteria bacterium]MDE0412723.1 succinylglutamate desuccinylase/aspartoacylase family protein [Gammaproteobacteria bacterium]